METAPPSLSRRAERYPVKMAVILVLEGEEADHSSLVVDFSPYGLRLQTAALLSPGQQVGLLSVPEDKLGRAIGARVIWVGKVATDQSGQAGLEFLRPLAKESLAV